MATYDYQCIQCNHVFETNHGMTESPSLPCPACGGLTEKKIGAGGGLLFKGGGFYTTDSQTSSSKDVGKTTGGSGGGGGCASSGCAMDHYHPPA